MRFLALDLAATTGYAIGVLSDIVDSGTVDFQIKKSKNIASNDFGAIADRVYNWLHKMHKEHDFDYMFFERPVGGRVEWVLAARYNYISTVCHYCTRGGIKYQGVPVSTIKKSILKGNAKKEEVIEAVRERGFLPCDDNEADAIALGLWVIGEYDGVICFKKQSRARAKKKMS